jgi:hypothetical protein
MPSRVVDGVDYFDREFCPVCDFLFPDDGGEMIVCARCPKDDDGNAIYVDKAPHRYNSEGKPNRVASYFPIADHIKAAFATKTLAKHAKYAWEREKYDHQEMADRELEDVFDGAILQELFHEPDPREDPKSTVYLTLAFDGVEVKKKVQLSYPYVPRLCIIVWHTILPDAMHTILPYAIR